MGEEGRGDVERQGSCVLWRWREIGELCIVGVEGDRAVVYCGGGGRQGNCMCIVSKMKRKEKEEMSLSRVTIGH